MFAFINFPRFIIYELAMEHGHVCIQKKEKKYVFVAFLNHTKMLNMNYMHYIGIFISVVHAFIICCFLLIL